MYRKQKKSIEYPLAENIKIIYQMQQSKKIGKNQNHTKLTIHAA